MIIRLPLPSGGSFLSAGNSAVQRGSEETVQRGAEILFGDVDSAFLPPAHRVDEPAGIERGGHLTVGALRLFAAAAVFVVDQLGEVTLYKIVQKVEEESILLSIMFSTNFLCSEIKL